MDHNLKSDQLTVQEAARELGLADGTIRIALSEGRLPFTVQHGRKIITRMDLEAYRQRTQPTGSKPRGRPPKLSRARPDADKTALFDLLSSQDLTELQLKTEAEKASITNVLMPNDPNAICKDSETNSSKDEDQRMIILHLSDIVIRWSEENTRTVIIPKHLWEPIKNQEGGASSYICKLLEKHLVEKPIEWFSDEDTSG